MVDMCELDGVFKSQGGGKMTETGKIEVISGTELFRRFKNYQTEEQSLMETLTNPRLKLDGWAQKCRHRRLEKLTKELMPPLKALFPKT